MDLDFEMMLEDSNAFRMNRGWETFDKLNAVEGRVKNKIAVPCNFWESLVVKKHYGLCTMDDISSWAFYPYFCARWFKMITWEHWVLLNCISISKMNLLFARSASCQIVSQQQRPEVKFYHRSASKFQSCTVALFSCHSSGVVGLPLRDHWQAFTVKSWRSWKDVCVREHPDSPALLVWIH